MKKIILKVSINIKDGLPYIVLQDEIGNVIMGSVIYNSIEQLARHYQKDNEYRNKERYQYYLVMEGQKDAILLFQRPIIHNYGEPNTYIDETHI